MASLYRRLLKCKDEYGGIQAFSIGSILRLLKTECGPQGQPDAFVFPYGCMVVWGTIDDTDDFLSLVVEDALQLRSAPAVDTMTYVHGNTAALRRDVITLQASYRSSRSHYASDDNGSSNSTSVSNDVETSFHQRSGLPDDNDGMNPVLERLAISCALAQSIKLGAFESALRSTIENTKHLPEELALSGEITASRSEISRLMGQLFLARYRYHLSGDLLMTPNFFWENELYLPTYNRVKRYLEVRERGEILNTRVEVMQELYKLLGDELTHKNSMALELAITVMIAFEILLTLITLAKESLQRMFSACALFVCLVSAGWALWLLYRRRRRVGFRNRLSRRHHSLDDWSI